jgi:hypothetical protein
VTGVGGASAVQVLVEQAGELSVHDCNDAGGAPDAAPDGLWSCGDVAAGPATLGLLADGRFTPLGDADPPAAGILAIRLQPGGAATGSAELLPAPPPGPPRGPGVNVVARVSSAGAGAPVVELSSAEGNQQLQCRDDGNVPDDRANDGTATCLGLLPALAAQVRVRGGAGTERSLGEARWTEPQGIAWLSLDASAGTVDTRPFRLALTRSAPGAGEGGPGGAPMPTPSSPAPFRAGALVATGALGLAVGWWLRRPRGLPSTVRPLASGPLWPGGPVPGMAAVIPSHHPLDAAPAVLARLAPVFRVLVVMPEGSRVTATPGHPAWSSDRRDRLDVEAAALALARLPGAPLAVLVVGEALLDPGAVRPDPLVRLAEGLEGRAWVLGVVQEGGGGALPRAALPAP